MRQAFLWYASHRHGCPPCALMLDPRYRGEMNSPPSVLVLEDDADISALLRLHLEEAGYHCDVEADGSAGLERVLSRSYDLLVLDLMLPGTDGLEICRRVRAAGRPTVILMLTARGEELDKVLGLELGADDYVTKPFSIREVLARVKALLRRVDPGRADEGKAEPFSSAGLTIDPSKRRATLEGGEVELTAKEFDLLALLARHPGRVFTRLELLDRVWGYSHEGYSHTVNSHINRLRSKLEPDPANPRYVLTVWGVGYRFADVSEEARSAAS